MIRLANVRDLKFLLKYDKHIKRSILVESINSNQIYILEVNNIIVGWLRYNLFWDNTPFMNMLYVLDEYRNNGYGKALVNYWENTMKLLGYDYLLTSTQSNENAQYFYHKLGYNQIGGFNYKDDPYELILAKQI